MRIVRVEHDGGAAMGLLAGDGSVRHFGASHSSELIEAAIRAGGVAELDAGTVLEGRRLAPVSDPSKVVAIGLNYVDHATEVKLKPPTQPLVFAKFPS
ncbi:MAG: hypothetical protein ABIZ57_03655, partial [Candidatus Limnocylindria bacterium]